MKKILNPLVMLTGMLVSATRGSASGAIVLSAHAPVAANLDFAGARKISSTAKICTLASASPQDENPFAEPLKVSPKDSQLKTPTPQFDCTFPADSLTVLRLKIKN